MRPESEESERDCLMDPEELEPRKKKPALRDLEPLAIAELEEYIAELKAEIARVEAKIATKQSHRAGAAAFFKSR